MVLFWREKFGRIFSEVDCWEEVAAWTNAHGPQVQIWGLLSINCKKSRSLPKIRSKLGIAFNPLSKIRLSQCSLAVNIFLVSVTGIILSLGLNAGSAMNPSMDFCARWKKDWKEKKKQIWFYRAVAAAWSGSDVPFSMSSPYWLIPLLLPPLGGTLGVGLHWLVNRHLPKIDDGK